jgi:hypothetical protein
MKSVQQELTFDSSDNWRAQAMAQKFVELGIVVKVGSL